MSVNNKINIAHTQRIDTSTLKGMESFTADDFRTLIKFMCGNKNYIIDGLNIINHIGNNIYINRNNIFLFTPNVDEGTFFKDSNESDIILKLPTDGLFYIEAEISQTTNTPVPKSFLNPFNTSEENPYGKEYTADNDFAISLNVEVKYSSSDFTENNLPIAKVRIEQGRVIQITDCRNMFFRTGDGGKTPSLQYNNGPWSDIRTAPTLIGTTVNDTEQPFFDVDRFGARNPNGFKSIKDYIDAIAVIIAEMKGSTTWYANDSANQIMGDLSLKNMFFFSELGHSMNPSDESNVTWSRNQSNQTDFKLRSEGSEPISWSSNYNNLKWFLGGSYSTGREWDSVNFVSDAISDQSNLFLELVYDVKLNGGFELNWNLDNSWGGFGKQYFVEGDSGVFQNITIGDFIKPESKSMNKYNKVIGYVLDDVLYTDSDGVLVDPESTALFLENEIGGSYIEPLHFFKSRYTSDDIHVETINNRLNGTHQSMNHYWLGRRNGSSFYLRDYGMMSLGESSRFLNDDADNAERIQVLDVLPLNGVRFQSVAGQNKLRFFDGNSYISNVNTISITKKFRNNWYANDGTDNHADKTFYIKILTEDDLVMNVGDELWVNISENFLDSNEITVGDVFSQNNTFTIFNESNSPIASYANNTIHMLAKCKIIDGVPCLVFSNGVILSHLGDKHVNQIEYINRIKTSGRIFKTSVVESDDYNMGLNEDVIMVKKPESTIWDVFLPSTLNEELFIGSTFTIKDALGNCDINDHINIKVHDDSIEFIDGDTVYMIESKYEAIKVVYLGDSKWSIV